MNNKNINDFLLAEYENIAKAFFNAYEITARWFKYYLIILATPFSIIALIYHNGNVEFDLFKLPNTIAILIFMSGLLCTFVSCIIINSRMDAILYARTVNGIRKYFVDQEKINSEGKQLKNIEEYLVLPTDVNKPPFLETTGELSMLVALMTTTNSLYLGIGLTQINQIIKMDSYNLPFASSFWVIFFLSLILHSTYYKLSSKSKEKTYSKQKQGELAE
jgi:hypothetical protein